MAPLHTKLAAETHPAEVKYAAAAAAAADVDGGGGGGGGGGEHQGL
jgi:hypothetical protein